MVASKFASEAVLLITGFLLRGVSCQSERRERGLTSVTGTGEFGAT